MRRVDGTRAAIRALRSYRDAPAPVRLFLAARLAILPRRALAREFAALRGRVLGVGSGHGLLARWLAELNPDVRVVGVDVAADRVAIAQATETRSPRVRILVQDVRTLDPRALAATDADDSADPRFDAATAVDLIHHIAPADRAGVADALARAVRPGGVLLIKDIAPTPRWKHAINRLHDRIVSGEATQAASPAELAASFERAGFSVEGIYRPSRLSPYPHVILRARRAPDA